MGIPLATAIERIYKAISRAQEKGWPIADLPASKGEIFALEENSPGPSDYELARLQEIAWPTIWHPGREIGRKRTALQLLWAIVSFHGRGRYCDLTFVSADGSSAMLCVVSGRLMSGFGLAEQAYGLVGAEVILVMTGIYAGCPTIPSTTRSSLVYAVPQLESSMSGRCST